MSETVTRCPRKLRSRRSLEQRRGDSQDLCSSDRSAPRHGHGHGQEVVRQHREQPCFLTSSAESIPRPCLVSSRETHGRISSHTSCFFGERYIRTRTGNKNMPLQEGPMVANLRDAAAASVSSVMVSDQ
jgi:hypothetical protein